MAETCGNCRHFLKTGQDSAGECHRYPPQLTVLPSPQGMIARGVFVPTKRTNSCGEHSVALAPA